ncbi:uncharacterized protein LOC123959273 [Micropterus dolomieu]|uniref:uncharacterized protein LOC123959273 n=1 Tax=Micropterus dolomieu TaxID=147949 RepID=UPI001E8D6B70|nr:uncharacterized protein LOC123959273 [Micropterus dolomieu]
MGKKNDLSAAEKRQCNALAKFKNTLSQRTIARNFVVVAARLTVSVLFISPFLLVILFSPVFFLYSACLPVSPPLCVLSPSAPEPSQRPAPASRQPPRLPATPASNLPHPCLHINPGSPLHRCFIIVVPYLVHSPSSCEVGWARSPALSPRTSPTASSCLPGQPATTHLHQPPDQFSHASSLSRPPMVPRLSGLSLLGSPCLRFPGVHLSLNSSPLTPFYYYYFIFSPLIKPVNLERCVWVHSVHLATEFRDFLIYGP